MLFQVPFGGWPFGIKLTVSVHYINLINNYYLDKLYLLLTEVCELSRPRLLDFGFWRALGVVHKPFIITVKEVSHYYYYSLIPLFPYLLTIDILHQVPQTEEEGEILGRFWYFGAWQQQVSKQTPPQPPCNFPEQRRHSRQNSPPAKRIRYR